MATGQNFNIYLLRTSRFSLRGIVMLKRFFDVLVASLALVLFLPLMAVVALLVLITMGRPILFKQERLGYRERTFTLVKFRTMRNARGKNGQPLPDSERLTPLGGFLRRTSLDELPQLWNVLRGDMSLVGPRPLYTHYLPYYSERERLRHTVRPGITGLAQVKGRNSLSWDERLELDVQYVERQSFWLDLNILVQTVLKVLRRDGVIVVPGAVQGPLDVCRRNKVTETNPGR